MPSKQSKREAKKQKKRKPGKIGRPRGSYIGAVKRDTPYRKAIREYMRKWRRKKYREEAGKGQEVKYVMAKRKKLVKGSPEALAWGKRMQRLRKKKKVRWKIEKD